jgi:hypothetical protein
VRYRVLSPWTIAAWAVLIVLAGVSVAVWLLLACTGGDADANRVQLDAIRTAGTIVVGTGGVAVTPVGHRRREVAAVLPFEHQHGSGMVRPYAFDHRHRSTVRIRR